MSNVPGRKSIFVQPETHKRLNDLKQDSETFDGLINRLLDLEDRFNPIEEVFEYEYIYLAETTKESDGKIIPNYQSRLFRVIYGETIKKQFYSMKSHDFEDNIEAWNYFPSMPMGAIDSFIKFIIKESNLYVLYEMEDELVQNNIWIKRV